MDARADWRHQKIFIVCIACFGLLACEKIRDPDLLTEFWGLKIGQSREDVLRIKGNPSNEASSKTLIYPDESSVNGAAIYGVGVWEGRVRYIAYSGSPGLNTVGLLSMRLGTSKSDVEGILGKPDAISVMKGTRDETHTYKKRGVVVVYKNGFVSSFGVTNIAYGPTRYIEEENYINEW